MLANWVATVRGLGGPDPGGKCWLLGAATLEFTVGDLFGDPERGPT